MKQIRADKAHGISFERFGGCHSVEFESRVKKKSVGKSPEKSARCDDAMK